MEHQNQLWVIFNKTNKLPIGFSLDSNITQGQDILYKVVTSDQPFNIAALRWEGDYDTGHLIDSSQPNQQTKHIVSEQQILKTFRDRVFRRYAPTDILLTFLDQLSILIAKAPQVTPHITPQCKEMLAFYDKCSQKLSKDLAFFEQSPDHEFVTIEQSQQQFDQRFASEKKS